jgi:hypothetical protein
VAVVYSVELIATDYDIVIDRTFQKITQVLSNGVGALDTNANSPAFAAPQESQQNLA